MKKAIFTLALLLCTLAAAAQGMSDSQVKSYIQREMKAGTSQARIW